MKRPKVLIIRLSAMGDVVFTIPLANALKAAGYEVTWLVGDKGYDLINGNTAVDEVIYISEKKRKKQNFIQNFLDYIKTIKYIRSKHFDISIDTQMLFKTFIYQRFCGAKRRIVSKSAREFAIFGGNEIIEKLYTSYETHVTQDYLKYANYLGIDTSEIKVTLPQASEEIKEKINHLLEPADRTKPLIMISPATTWIAKHWNRDNWKTLIQKLKNDYTLIYTGTEKDIPLIEYISEGFGLNLAGKTNITELCELLRRVNLVISLDSGTTHLAWGVQVPKIVSIFCCTPKTRYAPIGESDKYIALGNNGCEPCHKKKCPLKDGKNRCVNYPAVEEVFEAVHKLV